MSKQSKKTHVSVPSRKIDGTMRRESEWVTSMHEYYMQTGSYRTGDLDRVLGDPRKQVSGEAPTELMVSCRPEEK
jgi:hypothetical protein